ncbi:MAG: hypothetical protein U0183_13295 [Polyangiaceae bacterium]
MDALLARLERRFGRFAIPNVTMYIVGGMAITFALSMLRPEILSVMELDLAAVRQGQVWRLVSYLFIPRTTSLIFVFFQLSFTWFLGRSLEAEWGPLKMNLYFLVGMIGTTIAAAATGEPVGNQYLTTTLFLAFATLFPDYQITLYLIIPIRVKWLALLSAGVLVVSAVLGSWATRAGVLAATSNYFLFFGAHLRDAIRDRARQRGQASRLADMKAGRAVVSTTPDKGVVRACSVCQAREDEGADIRVCSCAKCGIPTLFCLSHARDH